MQARNSRGKGPSRVLARGFGGFFCDFFCLNLEEVVVVWLCPPCSLTVLPVGGPKSRESDRCNVTERCMNTMSKGMNTMKAHHHMFRYICLPCFGRLYHVFPSFFRLRLATSRSSGWHGVARPGTVQSMPRTDGLWQVIWGDHKPVLLVRSSMFFSG